MAMRNRKIRIGIVGCANIAKRTIIPVLQKHEQFEVVAVASRTLIKASEFAQQFGIIAIEGYENIIKREDIDELYIPLPTGLPISK